MEKRITCFFKLTGSILNLNETQELNMRAKIRKPNGNSKRANKGKQVVQDEIKPNEIDNDEIRPTSDCGKF